jgi:uncharacterized protein YndB with AHSA1/START domain
VTDAGAAYDHGVRSDGLSLEITRVFPAPRVRVFEFFVDPGLLARWWGPRGFSIPSIDFTPGVGSSYRIQMQPPEGDAFALTGTFHRVDASHLAFSFEWQPADPEDQETVAELSFRAIENSTEVHLAQGPFKTEARRALHRDGWTESFDKLAELVAE